MGGANMQPTPPPIYLKPGEIVPVNDVKDIVIISSTGTAGTEYTYTRKQFDEIKPKVNTEVEERPKKQYPKWKIILAWIVKQILKLIK